MDVGNCVLERLGRAWGVNVKVEMQGLRVISLFGGGGGGRFRCWAL